MGNDLLAERKMLAEIARCLNYRKDSSTGEWFLCRNFELVVMPLNYVINALSLPQIIPLEINASPF